MKIFPKKSPNMDKGVMLTRSVMTITLLFSFMHSVSFVFGETADLVFIEKEARLLTLKLGERQLAKFQIALGGSPIGLKQCEGDKKTPEGTYYIQGRNSKSQFYKSLRLSYPNDLDRKRARTLGCSPGGDIMIHGLPNGRGWLGSSHRLTDWTDGCIAVTDSEIDQVWRLVPDGTKVVVVP